VKVGTSVPIGGSECSEYQFNAIDLLPLALGRSKRKIYSGSLDPSDALEIIK
jgi:hypothetical protein